MRRRAEELAVKAKEVAAKRLVEYKVPHRDSCINPYACDSDVGCCSCRQCGRICVRAARRAQPITLSRENGLSEMMVHPSCSLPCICSMSIFALSFMALGRFCSALGKLDSLRAYAYLWRRHRASTTHCIAGGPILACINEK